jgi:hypothetical protein
MRYFVTVGSRCALLSAEPMGWSRAHLFWRAGGALLLAVPLAAVLLGLLAGRADAQPQIKVNCEVYATNHVDPIASSDHLHHQIGNTSTTNSSTGESLFDNRGTSCNAGWLTSAGWFPVERNESVKGVNVYYRAPGDQTKIKAIPKGLQLLATRQSSLVSGAKYSCNDGPFLDTPPYGCRTNWATSINFPDCINTSRLANEATNAVYSRTGVCPSTHPYRIPRINYLVMHDNADGVVPNPLWVSAGVNTWELYSFMHADYFAANQPVFNNELLDLCLRDAPDRVTFASPRCGEGP